MDSALSVDLHTPDRLQLLFGRLFIFSNSNYGTLILLRTLLSLTQYTLDHPP